MNILLISQCDKRALTETRRILDQYAERRGDRTWQTPITKAGLDTLRRLLRKTARRNTSVACHWIRGLDHSELLWIVGDASRFNAQGTVPTHSTRRDVLRQEDENDWHTAEDIQLLARMAALLHDLGKSCASFQKRLRTPPKTRNLYRHEWISLRLLQAFVGDDDDEAWLQRLAAPTLEDDASWLAPGRLMRDGLDAQTTPPFRLLPPLAAAIGWLVVSHHRLPVVPNLEDERTGADTRLGSRTLGMNRRQLERLLENISAHWNEIPDPNSAESPDSYWQFDHGLPVTEPKWRAKAARLANQLLALRNKPGKGDWLNNPYVMHLARLSLMLGDHHYSSLGPGDSRRVKGDGATPLHANTNSDGSPKQPLDEHLLGVDRMCASIVHGLPRFERHLPRLVQHKGLRKRSSEERFRWQDKAADKASSLRDASAERGAFIINMASTGCGKTLANARIMNALANPQLGMRCAFALGLRTLTRQTGESYRHDLHLGNDELAIRVGGSDSGLLQAYFEAQHERHGSASIQNLIDEDSHVFYEGNTDGHGLLGKAMGDPHIRAMLAAPLLVCTIDHLMPATEAQRAGRQIAPMLRLMSGDLVLDELDDFDLNDLPALTRLMHWAGMLGSRVLLSSATLPPALVTGMFHAYRAGRQQYRRNRGEPLHALQPQIDIPCLWVDEFSTLDFDCGSADTLAEQHALFVSRRVCALDSESEKPVRSVEILRWKMDGSYTEARVREHFADQLFQAMQQAHGRHAQVCPHSAKRVSFGLIRMANIEPLFDVALALFTQGAAPGQRVHLCVYHSRFPMILRSAIETRLDRCLNRKQRDAVYDLPEVRQALDAHPEQDHLFVVLGSPVTEVGRDHDYDWAIVEPSSVRSLVQLAGRVQRHRRTPCTSPNLLVFEFNLKHFENKSAPDKASCAAFIYPGFEQDTKDPRHAFRLNKHSLEHLLSQEDLVPFNARPRIQPRPDAALKPKDNLVDLEHRRLTELMLPSVGKPDLDATCAWQYPNAALTWALPQHQPFRKQTQPMVDLVFKLDDDEERLCLHSLHQSDNRKPPDYLACESMLEKVNLQARLGRGICPWGEVDLMAQLEEMALAQDISLEECARRFTPVSVPSSKTGWRYHPVLGFAKKSTNRY
ncbi:type I-F CRISPR-associated helicase Cas3f [Pseudomonas entomophila]|uniref:type I-F CRISPR-associated helicase Cas3f n=1 Tax=Pseudomonas entomophila TaxID=312306 RepID=UPI002406FF12|nr:type I-F CRISPR-associated helicase Cas3f [Pseudomonas entomophila]MDF9619955.1 type I-F CRISPR-associated helicase Cas3f [Pseudomonas entomophila]